MPRLWNETIEAHRREVRDAIMQTAATLAAEHGLLSVTMTQIAAEAGIGRATLYKYFPDVEAILLAWHDHHVAVHLEHLAALRDDAAEPAEQLETVLEAYALIQYELRVAHGTELEAFLHRREHVAYARHQLHAFVRGLLVEAVVAGDVRDDVGADELTSYCLHALAAANSLNSKKAVRRLVGVTLSGLQRHA
jgi:AcrR family transcriptional regulator